MSSSWSSASPPNQAVAAAAAALPGASSSGGAAGAGAGFVVLPTASAGGAAATAVSPPAAASPPAAPRLGQARPVAAATGAAGEAHTADGYTVSQVVADMQKLQAGDKREGGPARSPAQLRAIAQGIVDGVNKYFPSSTYGSPTQMTRTLVASAWKESKFDTTLANGGVFQCAGNRLDDYNAAHGTHIAQSQLSTNADPAQAIDISLWAMAHPSPGVIGKPVGGTPIPSAANNAILYYWNYNGAYTAAGAGRTEVADYMDKTSYFESLLAQ